MYIGISTLVVTRPQGDEMGVQRDYTCDKTSSEDCKAINVNYTCRYTSLGNYKEDQRPQRLRGGGH